MADILDVVSRRTKRAVFFVTDFLAIPVALYLAYSIRLGTLLPFQHPSFSWDIFPILMLAGIPLIYGLGLHRYKLLAYEIRAVLRVQYCALGLLVVGVLANAVLNLSVPRGVLVIFALFFLVGSVNSRVIALKTLNIMQGFRGGRERIAIYGAGSAGVQLINALRQTRKVKVTSFFDEDPQLQGQVVAGLPVLPADEIEKYVQRYKISRLVLAMPSLAQSKRAKLKKKLSPLNCDLQSVPSLENLLLGKGKIDTLETVSPDDLLGRDKVDLDLPGVAEVYSGKTVLVTGAGGSIGSELCRQLMDCGPAKIVLLEHAEFNLYSIEKELVKLGAKRGVEVVPVLGSVTDPIRVAAVFEKMGIDIVLHAAAYKHVPMVEMNEVAGLSNNVVGTRTVAEAALKHGAERFILVSTDKAVRPTNVMGATKRVAELLVQDFATRSSKTLFSMVRFGNVLGSSGSVIPLFQDQIKSGGPLTVTHADVTRYFMTIPEASRLVLLAGSFSTGGDVFVLDMGKPVKIIDLADRMVRAHGLEVKDAQNPDGDIEIRVTGLRPGEKLYEELLIGDDMLSTPHQKILRAGEDQLDRDGVITLNARIDDAVRLEDKTAARDILLDHVDGYRVPVPAAAE